MASMSRPVPMKQRNASSGVQTIGSPRTLKLVFTSIGQPVLLLKASSGLRIGPNSNLSPASFGQNSFGSVPFGENMMNNATFAKGYQKTMEDLDRQGKLQGLNESQRRDLALQTMKSEAEKTQKSDTAGAQKLAAYIKSQHAPQQPKQSTQAQEPSLADKLTSAETWFGKGTSKDTPFGERLKRIGSEARNDLERLMDAKVFLELWVKVRSGWADDEARVRSFGYE